MEIENAIDFLLFTYFGITLDDNDDKLILDKIVDRAYRDASSRVLSVKEGNEKCKDSAKEHIKCFLNNIKNYNFQELHKNCALELIEIYKDKTNDDYEFTYGIAQKWLNMSVKYLIIIAKVLEKYNSENEFYKSYKDYISSIEKNCDVPIDDYILEAAWSLEKENDKFQNKKIKFPLKKNKCKTKAGKYNSEKIDRWSSWKEPQRYKDFQTSLKSFIEEDKPLDWENKAWIKVAKNRDKSRKK